MDDLSERTVGVFRDLGFEVQPTSFSDITSQGDIAQLREYKGPDNDSLQILKGFPHFFLTHRSASPERGAFFVVLAGNSMNLPKESKEIYEKYFPKDLLIVGSEADRRLVGKWIGSSDAPKQLDEVIRRRLGT